MQQHHLWMMLWSALCVVCSGTSTHLAQVTTANSYQSLTRAEASEILKELYQKGDLIQLERVAQAILQQNSKVLEHGPQPSVYEYLGTAQYALGDLAQATATFREAVRVNANDTNSWLQLGNCLLLQMDLSQADHAFSVAIDRLNAPGAVHLLLKTRSWMANWHDRERLLEESYQEVDSILRSANANQKKTAERITGHINAMDYPDLAPSAVIQLNQLAPHSTPASSSYCCSMDSFDLRTEKLRVGFVSSDFGIHPVAQLVRGLFQFLNRDTIEVYCFSLSDVSSWWKRNITRTVDSFVSLTGKNPQQAAEIIKRHQVHVLIDLNGHTLHSGLSILSFRPAPVQITFLGYPMTIGSDFVDYLLSDPVSTPAESAQQSFVENLLLMPMNYIVNDHLQMLGHSHDHELSRLDRILQDQGLWHSLNPLQKNFLSKNPIVFATFSNWQKMDPMVFTAWMQIMAQVPNSVFWFLRYHGHQEAEQNLRREAQAHGIRDDVRFVFSDLAPWIHHTFVKRAADVVLDTVLKNGHTTLLDALWAGVPVVTLEGNRMSNRAGTSALHSLGLDTMVVNSLKEYVEVAVYLATNQKIREKLRSVIESNRVHFPLFDTRRYTLHFEELLRVAWASKKSAFSDDQSTRQPQSKSRRSGSLHLKHIFFADSTVQTPRHESLQRLSGLAADRPGEDEYEVRIKEALARNQPIRLHIGGQVRRAGWWTVDVIPTDHTDFEMNMRNLYAFPDNSVSVLYASHVLEHNTYGVDNQLDVTLREWHRVLRPDGVVYISVPDLHELSSLFVDKLTSEQERFDIMRMMFGGQTHRYDVHNVGFNEAILSTYLSLAGFCEVRRVRDFRLFRDTSVLRFKNRLISLNVIATKCT